MARIIDYVNDLRKHGTGYYLKELGEEYSDFIIVANNKRPFDSFVFMRATAFSDMLAKCGYGHLAKEVRDALFAIKEKQSEFYRAKSFKRVRK